MTKQNVQRVSVIGAGSMGHGIAHVTALHGFPTFLFDIDQEILDRARASIQQNLDIGVERGKVTQEERQQTLRNLTTGTHLATAVQEAHLVIEAVPESLEIKRTLFKQICTATQPTTILASNTSSLSVTELAASTDFPNRFVGMHFFNPPHILNLLELVRAEQTSNETMSEAAAFARCIGRELVVVSDSPGFASSRLGLVLGLEAVRMLQEGVASAADIDRAMELGYRHPMGPLRLTDLVGLDVRVAIADYLHRELGGDRFVVPPLMRRMVRAGKLGKKTGQGFYTW